MGENELFQETCADCAYMVGSLCRLHGNRMTIQEQNEKTCDHWFNQLLDDDRWCQEE